MLMLRQRIFGTATPPPRTGAPQTTEEMRLAPLSKMVIPKHRKRRNGLIFGLGGLFGIIIAVFFADKTEFFDFGQLSYKNLDMESLVDILPAVVLKDARAMSVRI